MGGLCAVCRIAVSVLRAVFFCMVGSIGYNKGRLLRTQRGKHSPMAKKVRKPRSSNPRTYSQAGPLPSQAVVQPPSTAAVGTRSAASTAAQAAKSAQPVDLAVEYSYVGKELRRLALTAAGLIALEIVLNLVLKQVL